MDGVDGVKTRDRVRGLVLSRDCRDGDVTDRDGATELFVDCLPIRVPMLLLRDSVEFSERDVFGVVSVPGAWVVFEDRE